MATPVRTPAASVRHGLAIATTDGGDAIGTARRGAAFALLAAVLVGSAGAALAMAALVNDAVAVGLVLVLAVLIGVALAANAWHKRFR